MTDIESQVESNLQYNELNNNVTRVQTYYTNEVSLTEICKLVCCFLATIIGLSFLIMAAIRGCIYNCQN